jgi:hypothetical protein
MCKVFVLLVDFDDVLARDGLEPSSVWTVCPCHNLPLASSMAGEMKLMQAPLWLLCMSH